MNKINNIENEEIKKCSETTESYFDDEGHKEGIDKIQKEKHKQKEQDLTQASKLTESLFEDKHVAINEFIEKLSKDGLNEEEIAKKIVIQGYSRNEFINSSINKNMKSFLENGKSWCLTHVYPFNFFRFKNEEEFDNKFFDILRECLIKNIDFSDVIKNIPLKRSITIEDIKNIKKEFLNNNDNLNIDLSNEVLPNLDWSKSEEVFEYLTFDDKTFSMTSKEHLPNININTFIKKHKKEGLARPLKRAITMEDINNIKKSLKNPDNNAFIDLSGEILPDFDWSKSREVFNYLNFDDKTFSKTSKEHLPKGFDPKEIFENGKTIGLGIDDVHKMGYTGKGVSVAICDWQLKPHNDIKPKEYIVEKHAEKIPDYFHASAVSSILTGEQTGIAPDASLYFYAEKENGNEKSGGDDLKSALTKILEKNQELPDNEKIRVISISGPLYGEGIEDVVKKLEDLGVWVLHSGEFWKDFGYVEKKDPMGDPNDFQNYKHSHGPQTALFVNSGDRTVASPKNDNAYRHDTQASASWAIPVVAGYYALACQADSSMTPRRFKDLARETSQIIGTYIKNQWESSSESGENVTIRVINIKALIQKIEEEKNK